MFEIVDKEPNGTVIKVVGVGGAGGNAVDHMIREGVQGVEFIIANTDAQSLNRSLTKQKLQFGPGLGAGGKPDKARALAEMERERIAEALSGAHMAFITAGMGGGTGTGAAPIIAKTAREMDILTVGIVTLPFTFEGRRRISQGTEGLEEIKKHVDTLIVISNDKLRQIHGNLSISEAFAHADNILTTAAKGIAEIITVPGYVNVDFEDVNTVMRDSGVAIMGTASAAGDDRAKRAVDEALHSPLLEDNDIQGAQHILLNITSGTREVTMDEIFEITEFVQEEAGYGTDLIWGNCYDESLGEKISVTVIATGFEHSKKPSREKQPDNNRIVVSLDDEGANDKKKGLAEIGFEEEDSQAHVFEFEDVPAKYPRHRYSYQEPYRKDEDKEQQEEERRRRMEEERKRREKLRSHRVKLSNPKAVIELENEPAFQRRGVALDDVPDSSEEARSKWTITDDDEPEVRAGNSFLHDNVD